MTDTFDELASALADRYRLERELGAGGMAVVYLASDLRHERKVAIKALRPELLAGLGADRFVREILATASMTHPHIVPVLDSGVTRGGRPYYVMPLIDGETLRDRLTRERQLPLVDALAIARDVADALSHAHSRQLVHRDIKPENILLSGGHALLADFGVAHAVGAAAGERLTGTGLAVGTPAYMSPEQSAGGADLDGRSDVYSLATVVYEMLAGEPPYTGPTAQAIIARRMTQPVPPLRVVREGIPEAVEHALQRALAKAPADRFRGAAEFSTALLRTDVSSVTAQPRRSRTLVGILAAAALLVLAVVALRRSRPSATPVDSGPQVSIAVWPFADQTGDPAQAYLAAGFTEEIRSALGQLNGVLVIAGGSVSALVNRGADYATVARELDVRYIIEGAVRHRDGRLRVTARLVNPVTGRSLWDESFTEADSAVLAMEESVARAIAASLRGRHPSVATTAPGRRSTASMAAYDLYLRALPGGAGPNDRRELEQRIALLEQAIGLDSTFAAAHAMLAQALLAYSIQQFVPLADVIERARREAEVAVRLDSLNAAGWTAVAQVRFRHDWDWAGANAAHRRSLALNPNDVQTHLDYARTLRSLGRFAEAEREYLRAQSLDPIVHAGAASRARLYYYARAYEQAVALLDSLPGPEGGAAPFFRFEALCQLGHFEEAEAVLRANRENPQIELGDAYLWARTGRAEAARAVLARAEAAATAGQRYVHPYQMALAYAALGDRDAAFRWLETGYRVRNDRMVDLLVEPRLDPLRPDPRWAELMGRMKFPVVPGS